MLPHLRLPMIVGASVELNTALRFYRRARLQREEHGKALQYVQRRDDPQGQRTDGPFVIPSSFSHSSARKEAKILQCRRPVRSFLVASRTLRPITHRVLALPSYSLYTRARISRIRRLAAAPAAGVGLKRALSTQLYGGVPGAEELGSPLGPGLAAPDFLLGWMRQCRARPVSRQRGCGPANRARS